MIAYLGRLGLVTACLAATAGIAVFASATQTAAAGAANSTHAAPTAAALAAGADAGAADVCSQADALTAEDALAAGQGDQNRKGCPRGAKPCPASQVGQVCDPSNPALLCSAQANGAYCCLAYADAANASATQPAEVAAAGGGGGGPCCTHQDRTSCAASCKAAGCADSIAACINLRCSCRCFGCP